MAPIATLGRVRSVQRELSDGLLGVGRRVTVGQPSPRAGPVRRDEEWDGGGIRGTADIPQETLQPRDFVTFGAHIGVPHHHRKVVPAQWVADRRRGRVDVHGRERVEDFPDPNGAQAVLIFQPSVAFVFIYPDDLLGHAIDVFEQRRGDRFQNRVSVRFRDFGATYLGEHEFVHLPLTEPVRAYQRVDRNSVLRQPTRVFHSRGGCLDALHRNRVLQRVQHRVDISFDAGPQQLRCTGIPPQFGDLLLQRHADSRGRLRQSIVQARSDCTDVLVNVHIPVGTGFRHGDDASRWAAGWESIDHVFSRPTDPATNRW